MKKTNQRPGKAASTTSSPSVYQPNWTSQTACCEHDGGGMSATVTDLLIPAGTDKPSSSRSCRINIKADVVHASDFNQSFFAGKPTTHAGSAEFQCNQAAASPLLNSTLAMPKCRDFDDSASRETSS